MKKTSIISILVILAFGMMGIGFAMWSDTVSISAAAQAGELEFNYIDGSAGSLDPVGDSDGDQTSNYGMLSIGTCPEAKNVGSTATTMADTNADGYKDKINVVVSNAYPCYFNDVSWYVANTGTIPLIIQRAKLTLGGTEYVITTGKLYIFCKNPDESYSLIEVPASAMGNLEQYYKSVNGVIEFIWGNNVGLQMHPGERAEQSFMFHVVQSAKQNTTYEFGLSIQGIQWNESPIEGHRPL